MKEYETLVLNAEERIREIEARLFREVCAEIAAAGARACWTRARALAELDVLAALAEAAALGSYARPEVTAEDVLDIRDGRHPVVEQRLERRALRAQRRHLRAGRDRAHHHRPEHERARAPTCARWR